MELTNLLSYVDHTALSQTVTWREIRALCDDAVRYGVAAVCIPPSYVKQAKEYVGGAMAVCTVVGFPNGYATSAVKCFETADAIANGADEIDMVINLGWVKEGKYDEICKEIQQVRQVCQDRVLKVIVETCLLTDEEKVQLCRVVGQAGAQYIKTSTGFSQAGATFRDVELFRRHVDREVKIKAAGGIRTLEDAEKFIRLGASRLGTSRVVKLAKEQNEKKEQ